MHGTQQELFSEPLLMCDQPESAFAERTDKLCLKKWSYSRRETFEKCLRLYYYNYYGANSWYAKADPQKPLLKFLKNIKNRHLRAGDIMHSIIRNTLIARIKGQEWSPRYIEQIARKKLQADIDYSSNYAEGTTLPTGSSQPSLLMEIYFGIPGAEDSYREIEEKLIRSLKNFQASQYLPFRDGATGDKVKIESPISIELQDMKLSGKVDLAFLQNNRATVVDWKMGSGEGGEDSLQLLFYALWAMRVYGCQPNQVDIFKAYLGSGIISSYKIGPDELSRAEARIGQDMERMRAVDQYGRDGVVEAFTPCGQERVCMGCVFQRLCPKE